MDCAKPEQGLESGHWGASSVVAEDELVEVDGQVFVGDAAVSAMHPRFEVGDGSVHPRQQLIVCRGSCLFARVVLIAELGQPGVGVQPVGVDDRCGGRRRRRECLQRLRPRVGQHLKTQTPRAGPSDLDRGAHQGLFAVLAAPLLQKLRRAMVAPERSP